MGAVDIRMVLFVLTLSSASIACFSQKLTKQIDSKKIIYFGKLGASLIQPGKAMTYEGAYQMRSHIQSKFVTGISLKMKLTNLVSIFGGLDFEIGKRNYFINLTAEDVQFLGGVPYIEGKSLWKGFKMPLGLAIDFSETRSPFFFIAGLALNYTGLNRDLDETWIAKAPDGNWYEIFQAQFSYKKVVWLNYSLGIGKSISLKNQHVLSLASEIQLCPTDFSRGDFEVSIPNKPITRGQYRADATGIGVIIQYSL
jgi:hypothetical protein